MDPSWKFRPLSGDLCPACLRPHFPFCAHPPSIVDGRGFAGNIPRRYHPEPYHPVHDPMLRAPPPPPWHPSPMAVGGGSQSWGRDLLPPRREMLPPPFYPTQQRYREEMLEREGFQKRMKVEDMVMLEKEGFQKRMKVEDMVLGYPEQFELPNACSRPASGLSAEDERRLSLIRDHGQQQPNGIYHPVDGPFWEGPTRIQHGSPADNGLFDSVGRNQFASDPQPHVYDQQGHRLQVGSREGYPSPPIASDPYNLGMHHPHWKPSREDFHEQIRHGDKRQYALNGADSFVRKMPYLREPHDTLVPKPEGPDTFPFSAEHNYVEKKRDLYDPLGDATKLPSEHSSTLLEGIQRRHFEHQDHLSDENSSLGSGNNLRGSNSVGAISDKVTMSQNNPPLPPQPLPSPPPEPSPSHHQVSSVSTAPALINPGQTSLYMHQVPRMQYPTEDSLFPTKHSFIENPMIVDASHIFKKPHRATRPDHIVVILRGLSGSGKSYLAKLLRDVEVENGGSAPRIHSMDDYFMIEVEKVEDADGQKSYGSGRGKRQTTKKVLEYCYEPEMEEAYRASMLKAYKKTLDEGAFTFVIVDDRNLRVADFAQFWAIGKMSGYEVYLLETTYKDPMGCAARNVHGFTSDDIKKMADKWEEAPPLYMKIDVQSLFHGNDLNKHDIQEVDMDMEDVASDEKNVTAAQEEINHETTEHTTADYSSPAGGRWIVEEEEEAVRVKELERSKWSNDSDDESEQKHITKNHSNSLSGLILAYGKNDKSVHWGDQLEKRGFSIGVSKSSSNLSLVIGPGSGYNLSSNPLPVEEINGESSSKSSLNNSRERSTFLEHLRAERESFRAVFDRRRQRIGGINDADDD